VYLQIVVARLALVELDRGAVRQQRQRRQHGNGGGAPRKSAGVQRHHGSRETVCGARNTDTEAGRRGW